MTQAIGKIAVNMKDVDMASMSAHKIFGPKGIGFLYASSKVKLKPIIFGGGQQKGMRSGTENVPAIAGLGVACQEIYTDFEKKQEHLYNLREHFIEEISSIEGVGSKITDPIVKPKFQYVTVKGFFVLGSVH